jgi:hypothetical protein
MLNNKNNDRFCSNDFLKTADEAEKKAAIKATESLFDNHVSLIMDIRKNSPLPDVDLLSISLQKNSTIDAQVKESVCSLQKKMRTIIETLAYRISERNYRSTEEVIQSMDSYTERETAGQLLAKERQIHSDCLSMKLIADFFLELNQRIIENLNKSLSINDKKTARRMVLGNALLVYELLDFVINYVENFKIHGYEEIKLIHNNANKEHERLMQAENIREQNAKAPDINPAVREKMLKNAAARKETIEMIDLAWKEHMNEINKHKENSSTMNSIIPELKLMRDDAKGQIEVLEHAAVIGIVQLNVEALRSSLETLLNLELVMLSPDKVNSMFGLK